MNDKHDGNWKATEKPNRLYFSKSDLRMSCVQNVERCSRDIMEAPRLRQSLFSAGKIHRSKQSLRFKLICPRNFQNKKPSRN